APPSGSFTPPPTGRAAAREHQGGGGPNRKRIGVIAGSVVAVLAIGGIAAYAMSSGGGDKEDETEPTPTVVQPVAVSGQKGPFSKDVKGVKFSVPNGWEMQQVNDTEVCVVPSDLPAEKRTTCLQGGLRIWVGKTASRKVDLTDPVGWTLGAEPACVTAPNDKAQPSSKKDAMTNPKPGTKKADLTYNYVHYTVTCAGGAKFEPQLWWLPDSMISFSTAGLARSYDGAINQLLASVDTAGYTKPKK
ncbi:hypothetical protein GT354_05245, partial [Streptomyces sp. SID3343]|nr:hypothetical protein [Streptomyces sp. SID3343]